MKQDKVTIIIPTYNRSEFLTETLESVQNQSYKNWECIIVDDGSTENNIDLASHFVNTDHRFLVKQRENYGKPKGANACRNIGLLEASGDYIIFFDSDDLMTQDHVETKLKEIQSGNYDFAVAKTEYFNNPENIHPMNYRELGKIPFTAENFITRKINWITFDPIIKAEIAKKITFNEILQANQEFNYFSKLILLTEKAKYIDRILSLRRLNEKSIQGSILYQPEIANQKAYLSFWHTYLDIEGLTDNKTIKRFLLDQCLLLKYKNKKTLKIDSWDLYKALLKNKNFIAATMAILRIYDK